MGDEWVETTLGEVAEIRGGGTPSTKEASYWNGDVIWLTPTEVVRADGQRVSSSERQISQEGLAHSSAKLLPPGTVLLTSRASVGFTAIADVPLATNQGFQSLIPRQGVLSEFLMYWIQGNRDDFSRRASGSTFPEISKTKVASIPILIPPLQVQRRIVDLMGHLDNHLANVKAEREALSHAVSAARAIAFLALRDRGTATAADMFSMLLGRQKSERQSVGEHVIPYIRAANISLEGVTIDDMKAMNFSPAEQEKYCLHQDDILLVEGGTVGLAARWTGQVRGAVGFDKHVIRLRAIPGRSTSEYALQWARWSHQSGAFDGQATGITIRALGFGRACAMPVPNIPVAEQEEITAPLAAYEDHERALKVEIERLQTLRTSLLASLLSSQAAVPSEYDSLLTGVA